MTPDTETLSSSEQAYFDTRGETEIPADDTAQPVESEPVESVEDLTETVIDPVGEDDADAPAGEPGTSQKTVPLAALTKTRQEAKELKARALELERQNAILADRWEQVLAHQQHDQAPAVVDEIPDPNASPMEALAWVTRQLAEQNKAKEQEATRTAEQQAEQREWEQAFNTVNTRFVEASEADPAVSQARDALIESYGREYMAMGLTQEQAQAEINRVEREHIRFAHAKGLDIADYVKGLASARGWRPEAVQATSENAGEKIDKLNQAMEGATSLSGASGGAVRTLTAQSIADMSADEFGAWISKPGNSAKFRKIAGG